MPDYTIKKINPDNILEEEWKFVVRSAKKLSDMYKSTLKWQNFNLVEYARDHRITLCRKNGVITGMLLASIVRSAFDPTRKIIIQDLLYSEGQDKTAYLLMQDFIDFGRANAHHIFSSIGAHTNIKPRSLEKLGFRKIEEVYGIGVTHGS